MNIKRGHIWLADLNPALGTEIQKTRPVVVVNSDEIGGFNRAFPSYFANPPILQILIQTII